MRSIGTFICSLVVFLYAAAMRLARALTDKHHDFVEGYREEFEEYALTQPSLTGIRFTRGADGKYLNEELEKAWVNFHEARFQQDNAW